MIEHASSDEDGELARRLVAARKSGDADELADALARHADALIKSGDFAAARAELDEAAGIHQKHGRTYDQARLSHMAASLSRMAGDLPGARRRAQRALELVAPDTQIAASALTELGEDDVAEGKFADAADHYTSAITAANAASFADVAVATLYRRRAGVLARIGRHADAVQDLELASERFARGGDLQSALRVRVEQATAAQEGGDSATAQRTADEARRRAEASGDHLALADLNLLASAAAIQRADLGAALAAAHNARQDALVAVAPHLYAAAAIAIAQLSEEQGERVAAYAALANGWATLRDLLGAELARATFEPKLQDMEARWGTAALASIKAEYEAGRRAVLPREQAS
jgi:tetratricopeptide (TPR) repeat protein